jgi:hypothetical protein
VPGKGVTKSLGRDAVVHAARCAGEEENMSIKTMATALMFVLHVAGQSIDMCHGSLLNGDERRDFMKLQMIFEQSRIYGGLYGGDELPQLFHMPVKDSWFQKRLEYIRRQQKMELLDQSKRHLDRPKK